jgi:hypothetical protein
VIVGSILLIVVAACLLVAGAVRGSDALYYLSIVSSVLAALALIVGLRPGREGRLPDADFDVGREAVGVGVLPGPVPSARAEEGRDREGPDAGGPGVAIAGAARYGGAREGPVPIPSAPETHTGGGAEPPDEPPMQTLTGSAAARMARLSAEVAVIDGRPRYHVAGCLHLLGRNVERLPLTEAVELGFTPCSQCEPATELLDRP